MDFERHQTWFLCSFISSIIVKGAFLCTCSLVALPVSTVFQLASRDYKNGSFRGPDLLCWWTLRDIKRGFCAHSFHLLLWKGLFYALARWCPRQCRLFLSWPAKTLKTSIFQVVLWLFDERLFVTIFVREHTEKTFLLHPITFFFN